MLSSFGLPPTPLCHHLSFGNPHPPKWEKATKVGENASDRMTVELFRFASALEILNGEVPPFEFRAKSRTNSYGKVRDRD